MSDPFLRQWSAIFGDDPDPDFPAPLGDDASGLAPYLRQNGYDPTMPSVYYFLPKFGPTDLIPPAGSQTPQYQSAAQVPMSAYAPAPTFPDPNAAAFDNQTRGRLAQDALNDTLNQRGIAGKTYSDIHDALSDWADAAQPVQTRYGTEVNSSIYATSNGGWQISPARSNGTLATPQTDTGSTNPASDVDEPPSAGSIRWGYIHTHPTNQALDGKDRDSAGYAAFATLPDGRIYGWNPGMHNVPDSKKELADPSYQYLMRPAKGPYGF